MDTNEQAEENDSSYNTASPWKCFVPHYRCTTEAFVLTLGGFPIKSKKK